MRSGDTLTLGQRIAHHLATGMSTVQTVSENSARLVTEFKKFYDNSRTNPPGGYKTYVIKNDNPGKDGRPHHSAGQEPHTIWISALKGSINGFDNYVTGKPEAYTAAANDLVINAYQPKAVLLNVLFEPKTFLADSDTYDITAWSLPYAYGFTAYGVKESLKPLATALNNPGKATANNRESLCLCGTMGMSVTDVKFLAGLLKERHKSKVYR